jgi:hypothetical protein
MRYVLFVVPFCTLNIRAATSNANYAQLSVVIRLQMANRETQSQVNLAERTRPTLLDLISSSRIVGAVTTNRAYRDIQLERYTRASKMVGTQI